MYYIMINIELMFVPHDNDLCIFHHHFQPFTSGAKVQSYLPRTIASSGQPTHLNTTLIKLGWKSIMTNITHKLRSFDGCIWNFTIYRQHSIEQILWVILGEWEDWSRQFLISNSQLAASKCQNSSCFSSIIA